ncbi:MAG: type II secretion system GspH family protein [Lentisphaerales bacterium]|nr:type II secretion system GspH family protein [Lentisphaerales bacterium]
MRKVKWFTLIELLLVIAIMGILTTILMPALAKVRSTTVTAVCKSQQRQLAILMEIYSSSNEDYFPPAAYNGVTWDDHIVDYLSQTEKNENPLPDTVSAAANDSVFQCPADHILRTNYIKRSYSLNSGVSDWGQTDESQLKGIGSEAGVSNRHSAFSHPSELIMLGERYHGANHRGGQGCASMGNANAHLGNSVHHITLFYNFTFVDGHVEFLNKNIAYRKQNK